MGFFSKVFGNLNTDNGDDYNSDSYVFGDDQDSYQQQNFQQPQQNFQQPAYQQPQQNFQQPQQPQQNFQQSSYHNDPVQNNLSSVSGSLELKVIRPDKLDGIYQIADNLLENRTVVLNLEACNAETIRRMIDYLSGVAYAINGDLRKVSARTYVITPNAVNIAEMNNGASGGNNAPAVGGGNLFDDM